MRLHPLDAFEKKKSAKRVQRQLKKDKKYPVQHVRIVKAAGRLKWMVKVGGKNSDRW